MLLWADGPLLNAVALGLLFSAEMFDSRAWPLHLILLMQIWSNAALSVMRGDPVSNATWWIHGIGADI